MVFIHILSTEMLWFRSIIYQQLKNSNMEDKSRMKTYTDAAVEYVQRFERANQNSSVLKLNSIQKFRRYIAETPFLSLFFQLALDQIPQNVGSFDNSGGRRPGFLYKHTTDQMLDMLNAAVQTPPSFWPSELCGIPIYSILVDLMNTKGGMALFSRPDVNMYLRDILNQYGAMLKTQKSLKHLNSEEGGWMSEQALKYVDYDEFKCDRTHPHYGFKCWNDWFIRELAEGARPIDGVNDPFVIVHSSENYPLVECPVSTEVKATDKFWLKESCYSLNDIFSAEKAGVESIIKESFEGGTVYQGFLSPWCYHRWHSPVSGVVEKAYHISGTYYLQNPTLDISELDNYVKSQTFLTCASTRFVFIINTQNESIGRVAIIQIGMGEVSSCVPVVKQGDYVTKGQCIGRFQFGGSSHAIIFDRKAKLQFNPRIYERQAKDGVISSLKQNVNSWIAKVNQFD